MKARNILILIIGVAGGLFIFSGVFSQETGLTISPLTFELTANPGDVLENKLRVFNPTGSVIAVRMEVEDFTVAGERGQVRIQPAETETYSLAHWVKTIPETFVLEPKEQKIIDFIIEVPENAEPGGHYGSVLATTAGVIGGEFEGTAIAQKVGSLVLLSVSGEVRENVVIKEFSAPEFLETGPVKFTIRLENKGTVHVRPRGFVTITNWRDKKVTDLEFPQLNVLPESVRKTETTWNKKWLLGQYTATLVGSYGVSNTPLNPYVITFWVFPWKIVLGVALVSFFILAFFYMTRRRWKTALRVLLRGERSE